MAFLFRFKLSSKFELYYFELYYTAYLLYHKFVNISSVAVRICPRICFCGDLYQKMHFAGSNLSTDPKCPKCIYKISKNFRVEKSGEISRNLRFSRFFVPASKSDTHHGYGLQKRSYRQFGV